jgi:hypothetical protein
MSKAGRNTGSAGMELHGTDRAAGRTRAGDKKPPVHRSDQNTINQSLQSSSHQEPIKSDNLLPRITRAQILANRGRGYIE